MKMPPDGGRGRRCGEVCCTKAMIQIGMLVKHHFIFWVALLLLAACEAPSLRVGFVAGLTGPYAELGVEGRDAVLLAVAEVNAAGGIKGRPVELVIRDAGTDETSCAAALEEVLGQGVFVVIGPMISRHARVVLAAMERHPGVLFFSPTMSGSLLSGRDDMFLRTIAKATEQGELLARYAHAQGWRRVVLVQDLNNAEYTTDVVQTFQATGAELGLTAEVLAYGQGKPFDPAALVARLRALAPEAVVLVANALHTAAVAQEIRKAGMETRLVAAKWAQTADVFAAGGRAVEGMVLVGSEMRATPELARFQEDFRRRYGRQPSFAAMWTYDTARILFDAMGRSQGLTGPAVKEAILAVPVYQGLEREIRFDPLGDVVHDYRLVMVRDGRFVPLEAAP